MELREGPGGALIAELLVGRITGVDRDLARDTGYNVDTDGLGLFVRLADQRRVVRRPWRRRRSWWRRTTPGRGRT